jgi:hypothetical protein
VDQVQIVSTFGQLPLIFIQNRGQVDNRVAYSLQGQDTSVYFTSTGLTFALTAPITDTTLSDPSSSLFAQKNAKSPTFPPARTSRWILKLDFVGANPDVAPQGEDKAETIVSYFQGNPDQWHTGLPTFHRLVYSNLWPGIDLVYSGAVNKLKYEFRVKPGADPSQIRLAWRGASAAKVDSTGQMEISTPIASLQDEAPVVYQVRDGKRLPVAAAYRIQEAGQPSPAGEDAPHEAIYSFQISAYDPSLPLVIDPTVLVYCGYIGGAGNDWGSGIAVDETGAAYVTGWTNSEQTTFPVNSGPDLTYNGNTDAFVAKLRPDGMGLVYVGYIGGSDYDFGSGIAVDGSGAAYVTGSTSSDQTTFPVSGGPNLSYKGSWDAFVAKLRPDGMGLVYAGYIGGADFDYGYGIAVDGSGAAYVTGSTSSNQTSFPVTGGPDLVHNGGYDAFVARVRPDGTGLVYAGYIGGGEDDGGNGVVVDGSGSAFVTGSTYSDQTTFPVTGGPDLTFNGREDAFVARLRPDGTGLVYAGYIGGSDFDLGTAIALDGSGSAYITGYTSSDQTTFPVTGGPGLMHNGGYDAFVAKLRPDGTGLVYSGYIGGRDFDFGYGIAVDGSGSAYVTGSTKSDQTSFPVTGGLGMTHSGAYDAFVARLRPDGKGLVFAGYIGGSGFDGGNGIAVDSSGTAYVTGYTSSDQASFPVKRGPDLTYNGNEDAFVAKISQESLLYLYLPVIQR